MMDLVGTLREEIAKGELCLKADALTRCRFYFEVDGYPIGCFALRSTAPFEVRVERAWNVSRFSWDIVKKLYTPSRPQRHFWRIKSTSKVIIRELTARGDEDRDKVALTFAAFAVFDGPDMRGAEDTPLKFEVADLQGVRFVDG